MEFINDNDMEPDVDIDDNEINSEMIVGLDIMAVRGHYGVVDWRGYHPSPNPSFEEEVRRNPQAAMKNRLIRAKIIRKQGFKDLAHKLMTEAKQISLMIHKNKIPKSPPPKSKLRFSH